MEKDHTIAKLKQSLEKDFGDFGRTQYVIDKLQKELPLPKSDHLYIERMIKLCEPIIEESAPEDIPEVASSSNLVKCHLCDLQIKLDEKSVKKNNFWFHDKCFEKIPILETEVSQNIKPPPKAVRQHVIVKSKSLLSQMVFSGGLLASLVGTTYFLAGDWVAAIIGIWGSILYFAIFESQIIPKKKPDAYIVKTEISEFDSTLSVGLKKNSSVVVSAPPGLKTYVE